jgi:hypothetical protein
LAARQYSGLQMNEESAPSRAPRLAATVSGGFSIQAQIVVSSASRERRQRRRRIGSQRQSVAGLGRRLISGEKERGAR